MSLSGSRLQTLPAFPCKMKKAQALEPSCPGRSLVSRGARLKAEFSPDVVSLVGDDLVRARARRPSLSALGCLETGPLYIRWKWSWSFKSLPEAESECATPPSGKEALTSAMISRAPGGQAGRSTIL